MKKLHVWLAVAISVIAVVGARYAQAQNSYASIHGTVTDSSGAVVPGAKVTVISAGTGQSSAQTTDDRKAYYVVPATGHRRAVHGNG